MNGENLKGAPQIADVPRDPTAFCHRLDDERRLRDEAELAQALPEEGRDLLPFVLALARLAARREVAVANAAKAA